MTPDWRALLTTRLAALRLRPEREAEIIDELGQHLDDQVRERVAGGTEPDAAVRDALAELDAPGVLAQRLRAIETAAPAFLPPPGAPARGGWFGARWLDLRHSVRSLRRTPAFTATVVLTMALTIGPTTAMLSIANWLVWRPVPSVQSPDRLGIVTFATFRDDGYTPSRVSPMTIADLLAGSKTLEAMAGTAERPFSVAVDGRIAEVLTVAPSDASLFDTLGIRPAAGRFFNASEDVLPYGVLVAVIGDGLARRAFGTPEGALGKSVIVSGRRLDVVGVAPPGFRGITPLSTVEVWFPGAASRYVSHGPVSQTVTRRDGAFSDFVVRRRAGTTFAQVQAELDVMTTALVARDPEQHSQFKTVRGRLLPGLGPDLFSRTRNADTIQRLLAIGAILVVLGCANVANLLMFRGFRRGRDLAVRLALGASRGRLLQAQLVESCVLSVTGAAVGLGLAAATKQAMAVWVTPAAATANPIVPIDTPVLITTLALSIIAGVSAGLLPALMAIRPRSAPSLAHASARGTLPGRRLRAGFASLQLALSLAMLVGALLMVTTVRGLLGVGLGFDPTGVTVHSVGLRSQGYAPPQALQYLRDLDARLAATPGLSRAAFAHSYPLLPNWHFSVLVPGGNEKDRVDVQGNGVGPGYFEVVGIPQLRGRPFTTDEALGEPVSTERPVILSRALATRLFGGDDVVGRTFEIPEGKVRSLATVVGVVGDTASDLTSGRPALSIYEPLRRLPLSLGTTQILVKSPQPARVATDLVRRAAAEVDPALPVAGNIPLQNVVDRRLVDQRLFASVLSILGGLGFVLAAVGLYTLLAQTVSERTREFGIRMAIGASRRQVFTLVLRYALSIAAIGGVAGAVLALFGARLVESQLFGVTARDPAIYAAAVGALVIVVFIAAIWPARAATRVAPIEALRTD